MSTDGARCEYWDPSHCEGTPHCPARCPRFVDAEGEPWLVRPYTDADRDSLLAMYEAFDPTCRAQGIPPLTEERRESWIDMLTTNGSNFVATDGDRIVGHAVYTPTEDREPELAVFVHQDYQGRGLGTELCKHVIADAAAADRRALVLEVEPANRTAISVYERLGFERVERSYERSGFDRRAASVEMRLELSTPAVAATQNPPLARG